MWPGYEWRQAPEACAEDLGGFWKKSVSWVLPSEEDGWLSFARCGLVSGAHVVWGRWKSQVYLSPYVEKPLNSKVIKSFVPELRSRKCFCVSGFLCSIYMELWTFYVRFTHIPNGYVTMGPYQVLPLRATVDIGRGTIHFLKLRYYWCLTIRQFNVICGTYFFFF